MYEPTRCESVSASSGRLGAAFALPVKTSIDTTLATILGLALLRFWLYCRKSHALRACVASTGTPVDAALLHPHFIADTLSRALRAVCDTLSNVAGSGGVGAAQGARGSDRVDGGASALG